ncbi:MAG: helix-turn-helix domain-containing protein [Pseudomonadota bacterium]|nr:helix-turn-helix domain-containing protein [Pseudomonadota bacterium]
MSSYSLKNTDFVTITAPFLLIPDLSLEQKALLSKVASMQGDKRVLASNSYFAALLSVNPRSIQRWIRDLESKGFLTVRYSKKSNGQDERELYVNTSLIPDINTNQRESKGGDKLSSPHDRTSPRPSQIDAPPRQNVTLSNEIIKDSIKNLILSGRDVQQKEKKIDSFCAERFFDDHFWPAYPRKEKKERARSMWCQLNPNPEQAAFMLRCIEYLRCTLWKNREKDKIPLPTTWMSEQGWKDEIAHGWIQEEKNRVARDEAHEKLKQDKIQERIRKEEIYRTQDKIQAMDETDRLKLREHVIINLPLKVQSNIRRGQLDGIIDQLMNSYYQDWISKRQAKEN